MPSMCKVELGLIFPNKSIFLHFFIKRKKALFRPLQLQYTNIMANNQNELLKKNKKIISKTKRYYKKKNQKN